MESSKLIWQAHVEENYELERLIQQNVRLKKHNRLMMQNLFKEKQKNSKFQAQKNQQQATIEKLNKECEQVKKQNKNLIGGIGIKYEQEYEQKIFRKNDLEALNNFLQNSKEDSNLY